MSAEQEFERWFASHVAEMQKLCATPIDFEMEEEKHRYKAGFMGGRKSGLEEASGVVDDLIEYESNLVAAAIRQRVGEGE